MLLPFVELNKSGSKLSLQKKAGSLGRNLLLLANLLLILETTKLRHIVLFGTTYNWASVLQKTLRKTLYLAD